MGNRQHLAKEREFLRSHSIDDTHFKRYNVKPLDHWDQASIDRINNLEHGDNTVHSHSNTFQPVSFDAEFAKFTDECEAWKNDSSVLFWKKYDVDFKVVRRQKSGLCFMHAPVVLQHYLVSIHNCSKNKHKHNESNMIDMASYIKQFWRGDRLFKYIAMDSGGSATKFLDEINVGTEGFSVDSQLFPLPLNPRFLDFCRKLLSFLEHKPVLVSSFTVYDSFYSSTGGVSFIDLPHESENEVGGHAMVLIGGRIVKTDDGKEQFVFLLQNWWTDRYFIEVSADYLAAVKVILTFVESEITRIPTDFPRVQEVAFVETSADSSDRVGEM